MLADFGTAVAELDVDELGMMLADEKKNKIKNTADLGRL